MHMQEKIEEIAPKRWAGFKEAVPRTGQYLVSSGCVTPRKHAWSNALITQSLRLVRP